METAEALPRLRELAGFFLRLGLTAFGGPAAHVAMMEDDGHPPALVRGSVNSLCN